MSRKTKRNSKSSVFTEMTFDKFIHFSAARIYSLSFLVAAHIIIISAVDDTRWTKEMCAVNSRNTTMHPILVKIRRRNNQECLGGTGLTGGHEFSAGKGSVETITPPQSRSLKSQRRPPRVAQPSFNVNDPRWMWLHWSESSTECQGCIGAIGQFVFVPPFRVEWLCIRIASAPQSHDSIHHRARAKC